jgi:hypothetical protein
MVTRLDGTSVDARCEFCHAEMDLEDFRQRVRDDIKDIRTSRTKANRKKSCARFATERA